MGSRRKYNIAVNELEVYIGMPKLVNSDITFEHYPRNSKKSPHGFHQWQSTYILKADGTDTIDGLRLTLKSMMMADFWYHSFMLSIRLDNQENIFYQMEVYPDDIISHTEPDGTRLFGTHIHRLNQVEVIRPHNYTSFSWYDWLNYFTDNTNISIRGTITAPNEAELELW